MAELTRPPNNTAFTHWFGHGNMLVKIGKDFVTIAQVLGTDAWTTDLRPRLARRLLELGTRLST